MRPLPSSCLPFIREWEKGPGGDFAATTYMDQGAPAIGWGHRVVNRADPLLTKAITRKEADEIAIKDLQNAAGDVERALGERATAKLNDGQFAALVVFMFNIGAKQFGGSTMRQKLIDGKFEDVPAEFDKWIFVTTSGQKRVSQGLQRRRAAERKLWEGSGSAGSQSKPS